MLMYMCALKPYTCVYNRYPASLIHILEVGGGEDVHRILSSVLMEVAMQAIDQITHVRTWESCLHKKLPMSSS